MLTGTLISAAGSSSRSNVRLIICLKILAKLYKINIVLKYSQCYTVTIFFYFFFCLRSLYWRPCFLHSWDFTVFLYHSIHFNTQMVIHPSANHGPSCLTSVILRELMFQLGIAVVRYSTVTNYNSLNFKCGCEALKTGFWPDISKLDNRLNRKFGCNLAF